MEQPGPRCPTKAKPGTEKREGGGGPGEEPGASGSSPGAITTASSTHEFCGRPINESGSTGGLGELNYLVMSTLFSFFVPPFFPLFPYSHLSVLRGIVWVILAVSEPCKCRPREQMAPFIHESSARSAGPERRI